MLWLILSLVSGLSQSTRDLFSKRELQNLNEYVLAFSRRFFSLPFLLFFVFFSGIPKLDATFWLVVLLNVCMISVMSIFYMRALKISPLSLTIPMLAFTPLFVLLTSSIILGEFPGTLGLIGVLLIVFGTYVLSIKDVKKGILAPWKALKKEKGPQIMLVVAIIASILPNLAKIGVQHSDPLFFALIRNSLASGFVFPVMLMKSKNSWDTKPIHLKILFLIGFFDALMFISYYKAMEFAIVPYVTSVRRTNILFSVLYGYLFLEEKRIMERMAGALTISLGILIISLS